MNFQESLRVAQEIRDYYRRLRLIAIGTFGKETEDWGCSVMIDHNKEHRTVIWERAGLASYSDGLVKNCNHCAKQRPLHVEFCECGSTGFLVSAPAQEKPAKKQVDKPKVAQASLF